VAGEAGGYIIFTKADFGKGKEKVSKEKEKRELTPPPPRKERESALLERSRRRS
jgi:hypothetical protein